MVEPKQDKNLGKQALNSAALCPACRSNGGLLGVPKGFDNSCPVASDGCCPDSFLLGGSSLLPSSFPWLISHDLQAFLVNIIGVTLAVSHIDLSRNLTLLHTAHPPRHSLEIWVDESVTAQSLLPASLLHKYLVGDIKVSHELHK